MTTVPLHHLLMERYEDLRAQVVEGRPGVNRHGLALLRREGVAAWADCTNQSTPPTGSESEPRATTVTPTQLVALLASMALSTLQEVPG